MSSSIGIDTILDESIVGTPAVVDWSNLDQAMGVPGAYAIVAASIPVSTNTQPTVTLGGVASAYNFIGQSALGGRTTAFAAIPMDSVATRSLSISWGAGVGMTFDIYGVCIKNTRMVEGFLDFILTIRGDSDSPLWIANDYFGERVMVIHAGVFNDTGLAVPTISLFGPFAAINEPAEFFDVNKAVAGSKHMEFCVHEFTHNTGDYYIEAPNDRWRSGWVLRIPDAELFYVVDAQTSCETLDRVVMDLCVRAGVDPRSIDVERIYESIRGFAVIATYSCSEALRSLSQVFMFDPASYDKQIHFVPRGDDTSFAISEDNMVDTDDDVEQQRRADSISIPRVLHLNYQDRRGGLATDKQTSERPGDRRATGEISLQTVVIMESYEAAKVVSVNHKVIIEDAKGELRFSLPDNFLRITPADTGFVTHDGRVDRVRVVKCDIQDGYQEYTCLRDRQSALLSTAEGIPPAPVGIPPSNVIGPTIIEPLDIHIIRDADDAIGLSLYVAVAGVQSTWRGATVEISYDGGMNYVASVLAQVEAIVGELLEPLNDHPQEYPDYVNSTSVRLLTNDAELQSTTLLGMQNRVNRAIIGDEIVNFETVDEASDGVWQLSGFLRGRLGTAPASHAAGERFVLLERSYLGFQPASTTDIGRSITLRATTLGADPVATGTVVTFTYAGRSQIERAVGYLSARRDGSNMVVTWQGVGRLGGGAVAVHGARFAGYEVTFSDGTNPDIVVETDNQELTQNVSSLSASPITVSVVQQNDLTGDGPAVEVTVA